ncbi:MAG: hypothetical protein JST39_07095 [Bacteroidetes bacterium]|nr:hypothetical protein [Bacteroidota bacterium]
MSTITKTSVKKGQFVDSKHVDNLLGTYKKERWIHNNQRLGKVDSLSVWYGMNELSEFMQVARENGADGVRMYFGVYPEGIAPKPEYAGRQTIVMVATRTRLDAQGKPVTKHIYFQKENGGTELLAFNVGTPCPPDCGTILPYEYPYGIIDQGLGLTFTKNSAGDTLVL